MMAKALTTNWKPILKYAVIAVVLFVVYRLFKKGAGNVSDFIANLGGGNVQDVVDDTTPNDGTTLDGDWDSQAESLAQSQYIAMAGTGTDEDSLFQPLLKLNGAQLAAVYAKFGVKEGKNLFQWYAGELNNSVFTSLAYHDPSVVGCSTYIDSCYEKDFMRAIWDKSGLPITF